MIGRGMSAAGLAMAAGAAAMMADGEAPWHAPRRRKYAGKYGPFWGQPEHPRTKRLKKAQRRARKAMRRGEGR